MKRILITLASLLLILVLCVSTCFAAIVPTDDVDLGGLDWRGILSGAGRGALIGLGAGVVVVILIIVLLAVCGRKKRSKA